MLGLNTTLTVRRRDATTKSVKNVYTTLPGRIVDARGAEKFDPEFKGYTEYTHLAFAPFKYKNSAVDIQVNDTVWDNDYPTVKYNVKMDVDAAGARHHREIGLVKIEKK